MKKKLTLSIDEHLIHLAKNRNTNLSELLEWSIIKNLKLQKKIIWVEEIEIY